MMPPSRLDCPLSLKTPDMGNPGLVSPFLSVTILDPTASGFPAHAKNSVATSEVVSSLDFAHHATEGNAASFGWYCLGGV